MLMSQKGEGQSVPLPRPRLDAVDWLRGLVMVIMALDHVRDFFGDVSFDAIDPHQTTVRHFVTRWVTHFCAPNFLFLTGAGAYLYLARGKSKRQLAYFLFTRGLWLLLLELTIIRFFWLQFDLTYEFTPLGVFWAIGWSMVLMAPLVLLPDFLVTCIGVVMVFGHNALDHLDKAVEWGRWEWLWQLLHGQGDFQFHGMYIGTAYKIIPWVGVMMTGYGFGRILLFEAGRRRRWLIGLGLGMIVLFLVLRSVNVYGDRVPRLNAPDAERMAEINKYRSKSKFPVTEQPPLSPMEFQAISFCNCEKYPPSLSFLLMTLGPAILVLALVFDRQLGPLGRAIVVFGRVPLFYYLMHLVVIMGGASLVYLVCRQMGVYHSTEDIIQMGGFHTPLWGVYLIWLGMLVILYFPCKWYSEFKRRSRNPIWSYL